jgi:hypothetical protein
MQGLARPRPLSSHHTLTAFARRNQQIQCQTRNPMVSAPCELPVVEGGDGRRAGRRPVPSPCRCWLCVRPGSHQARCPAPGGIWAADCRASAAHRRVANRLSGLPSRCVFPYRLAGDAKVTLGGRCWRQLGEDPKGPADQNDEPRKTLASPRLSFCLNPCGCDELPAKAWSPSARCFGGGAPAVCAGLPVTRLVRWCDGAGLCGGSFLWIPPLEVPVGGF